MESCIPTADVGCAVCSTGVHAHRTLHGRAQLLHTCPLQRWVGPHCPALLPGTAHDGPVLQDHQWIHRKSCMMLHCGPHGPNPLPSTSCTHVLALLAHSLSLPISDPFSYLFLPLPSHPSVPILLPIHPLSSLSSPLCAATDSD